jgi:hypothetical protein
LPTRGGRDELDGRELVRDDDGQRGGRTTVILKGVFDRKLVAGKNVGWSATLNPKPPEHCAGGKDRGN